MVAAVILRPPWFPTPGAAAFNNQPTGDRCVRGHREWGTMAAAAGHLGHDVSTDIVGLL
jgi:hypothetical protein